ncbi:MAG: co-chaperone GroES [Patescibacteria group bacterium]|jgi:chaperonin GroES|nr:co-chaperone GroES [Patescibacteria group bacterium]
MEKIQPLGENVLIEVVTQEKMTESGIVLPDTVSEEKPQEGKIIAIGDSKKINENIKKGSLVIFAKYSGTEIEVEKKEYLILKAEDILAVVS